MSAKTKAMRDFRNFVDWEFFVEDICLHENDGIPSIVTNGKWDPPLESSSYSHEFWFNIKGDGCGDDSNQNKPCSCQKASGGRCLGGNSEDCYCYNVSFSGSENSNIGISFYRGRSYQDQDVKRKVKLPDGTEREESVGKEVFDSVLHAIGEYVRKKNPISISWSAVYKSKSAPTGGNIPRTTAQKVQYTQKTGDARGRVYEKWCVDNLFPHKYLPVSSSRWVRRDIYEDQYQNYRGYPDIPDISPDDLGFKKRSAHKKMKSDIVDAQQRGEESETSREERISLFVANAIDNPTLNPSRANVGDTVNLRGAIDGTTVDFYAKVMGISAPSGRAPLLADLNPEDFESYKFSVIARMSSFNVPMASDNYTITKKTREETEARRKEVKEYIEEKMKDDSLNPNKLGKDDKVFYFNAENPSEPKNGIPYKIYDMRYEERMGPPGEGANLIFSLVRDGDKLFDTRYSGYTPSSFSTTHDRFIFKRNETNLRMAKKASKPKEPSTREPEKSRQSQNLTTNIPGGIRIGDMVKVTNFRHRGKTGKVLGFNGLMVKIEIDGDRVIGAKPSELVAI